MNLSGSNGVGVTWSLVSEDELKDRLEPNEGLLVELVDLEVLLRLRVLDLDLDLDLCDIFGVISMFLFNLTLIFSV